MLSIAGWVTAIITWLSGLFGIILIFFLIISSFFGFSPIIPIESEEIDLIFHVYWPENGTDWLAPLEDPPHSVRIVRADTTDGYESTGTPNWSVIQDFLLEPLEGANRTFIAQGSIPTQNIDYLAAVSGIPPNYFDGVVAVKLDEYQEGDIVELVHMEALLQVDKPNIYLYSNTETIIDTIEVEVVNGHIVESDPYSHSESHVIWEKVVISPEGMSYENNSIEWLFYEAVISSSQNMYDSVLDYGWYIEKKGEEYIFNGTCYSFDKFQLRFYDELLSIGLFPNEVDDFVEWWFDADSKLLPIDGKFALRLINSNWIDQNFIISTGYSYDQLRLFFLCHPLKEELNLKVPPPFSSDLVDLVLHEWGVIPYF